MRFFIKSTCFIFLCLGCLTAFTKVSLAQVSEPEEGKKRAVLEVEERKITKKKKEDRQAPQLKRSAVMAIQVEKKLIKGIDKTTRYLEKTASALPKKSAQRLQILERILNLHMEQASYVRSEEERQYDAAWRKWIKDKVGKEPTLSTRKSDDDWKKVIQEATKILNEYPRSPNADVITFNKAVGLQYLKKEKAAARMYSELIQKYPNSNVAGNAYSALGDYFFDRNDFRNAESNYKKALKFKRSQRYLWSVFKLGWCTYNLGRYKSALGYWKQLVQQAKGAGASGTQLKDEAMRDMVYAFAELRDVEGAISYYRANGGSHYIGPFLMLLSEILSDQGHYKEAVSVLKRYQKVAPTAPDGPNAQKEITSLYYALSDMPKVWFELARFSPMYGPRSMWSQRNKKEEVEKAQAMIKDQIMYYSTLTHQKAIKDNDRRLNVEARRGYLLYLKMYPKDKEVAGIKYFLADIAFFLKEYEAAGRYYMEIASLGKKDAVRYNPKTGKALNMHNEVSIDMVRAFVKDFEQEFKVIRKLKPDFKKPKPLSNKAKNYIVACEKYSIWYPKDSARIKDCDKGVTDIYYRLGHKTKSIEYLKKIAFKYPQDKEGLASVELLIPLMADNKKDLIALSINLLKVPQYKKGDMGDRLRGLQRGAEKESIGKVKDNIQRAKAFERQARKYPKDPDVDKLWYNAAIDYTNGGDFTSAIRCHMVIVKRFPTTPQAKTSLLQIARIYEKQLAFGKASELYLAYVNKYPKEKDSPAAFSKSCELLVAVNSDNATKTCLAFAGKYPDASAIFIARLITSAERNREFAKMNQLITQHYLTAYKLSPNEKIVMLAKIYNTDGGKSPASANAAKEIMSVYSGARDAVTGEALRYVGELVFKPTGPVIPKFKAIKLEGGTVENLLKSIQQKAGAFQEVEQVYGQVLQTKDAYWGVAAFYQLGLANEIYAEDLENPPAIKGASIEDVKKELAPQAMERRKIAFARYKDALETVSKFKVYNSWSIKVINAMARVSGKTFTFDDMVMTPDFLGTEVPANLISSFKGGK